MIKILQDNGRIIIIIENDDNMNMQKLTEEITKTAMSLCVTTNQEKVEGLEAIEPTTEDVEEIINEASKEEYLDVSTEISNEEKIIDENLYDANYLYPGEKPIDVISSQENTQKQDEVCVTLYKICKDIQNKKLKQIIIDDLKTYLKNRFADLSETNINNLSQEEISNTLIIYEPLVKNTVKYILQQAGYLSLEDFIKNADRVNNISAYYAIISNLMKQSWINS